MQSSIRYHATPATSSRFARGRWFEDLGRAIGWAEQTATAFGLEMVVWQVNVRGPVKLKLLRRIHPAVAA